MSLDSSESMILCFMTKVETRATEQTGRDRSRAVGKSSENKSAFPTPGFPGGSVVRTAF